MMARTVLVALMLAGALFGQAAAQGSPVTILADLDPNSATGIRIEGLVADGSGNLYTADLDSRQLNRIDTRTGAVAAIATLPRPGSGMAFDRAGNLYMASGDAIQRIPAAQFGAGAVDPGA